jgi:hypothetical protein
MRKHRASMGRLRFWDNKRMRNRLLLLPAVLLFALGLRAEDEMTKLTVEVRTQGGRPVDRAGVVVRFVEGRSIVKFGKQIRTSFELRTNQDGVVKIPSIPQGKILVQVIAKGYQTFGKTFDVGEEEKIIEVKLNPPQAQYSSHQDK